jgi:Tfp pilus assembly protein PilN
VIRTNLATRPFYNERAVLVWVGLLVVAVAAATVFNVLRVVQYSGSNTELATEASRDETRAGELRTTAARLRGSVDARQIEAVSLEAHQANELIDRRTFSWTELFNRFETTLPPDVRITAVRPQVDKEHRVVLTLTVLARGVDDVNQFMENLEGTGAFASLLSRQERLNEEDQIESVLETVYVPHPPQPRPSLGPTAVSTPSASSRESTR